MKLTSLSLPELESLLQQIVDSRCDNQEQLIRSMQNAIADRYFEMTEWHDNNFHFNILEEKLKSFDVSQLESWLESFIESGIQVPRELVHVLAYKKEIQSSIYMMELIKSVENKNDS